MSRAKEPNKVPKKKEEQEVEQSIAKTQNEINKEAEQYGIKFLDHTKHWVKFNFIEQPGQTLEFYYGKTVYEPRNANKRKTETEHYKLVDGTVYELPKYIIDHLHSKQVPDSYFEKGANGLRSRTIMRNRFSCEMANPPLQQEVV
jgi:hypothetical protein